MTHLSFLSLISSFLFLSLNPAALAYELPRWDDCDGATNYTANSTFAANLGQALDALSNSTAPTGFNATIVGNGTESVTALALCRADTTQAGCRVCIDAAVVDIRQKNCPMKRFAQIWYNDCMLRYADVNFLSRADVSVVLSIWNTMEVSNQDVYDQSVRMLMRNLSNMAGESQTLHAVGWTRVPDNRILYGYVECTRDLSADNCSRCLSNARIGIENCCMGQWAAWVATPSCSVQFSMDPGFFDNTTAAVPEILAEPPLPPPPTWAPESDIQTDLTRVKRNGGGGRGMVIGISGAASGTVILTVGCSWMVMKGKKKVKRSGSRMEDDEVGETVTESVGTRSFLYDLETLMAATDNFSTANRLGCGGFGTVYKGKMPNGEKIAVKKLTVGSAQGTEEFTNEVRLLQKMQHRNLVKLFGCCIQGQEKILVYEYLSNRSLDHFLFDKSKSALLDWPKRFNIIIGIARGLLYLHEDSQYRIIHRDIKASNILLDEHMNPKISDFGLAKLFPDERSQLRTRRIAGTFGYMAPEYAARGFMSAWSDVYSFGVLILEIISGRRNYDSQLEEQRQVLLNLTWRLEQQGKLIDLVDVTIGSFPQDEVLRCIRVGLLCCQQRTRERPIMSSALVMLSNQSVSVPTPVRLGYQGSRVNSLEISESSSRDSSNHENENASHNNSVTISVVSGR
nr:TPA_asm: hypothetical protein HUJ06_010676 [Nelumbo nucifera]